MGAGMVRTILTVVLAVWGVTAQAFCGFYVAKADGDLFNEGSRVVYFREGTLSVITMASDYKGAAEDFAMIVPTPVVLPRPSIQTVDPKTVQHLDDYSAPRLVEYFDREPLCNDDYEGAQWVEEPVVVVEAAPRGAQPTQRQRARSLGVSIEAKYAVGSYDILILGAKESDGLATFLTQEGYKLPDGAAAVLGQYIKGGMKFFVARVNLKRHADGPQELQPLQIRFKSKDFMLPIQLGKVNGDGPQDVLMLMLSRKGRIEPTNYKAVELPTNLTIPGFVEKNFGAFYKAMFARAAPQGGGIVLEYAWDMGWCDPCAADPLNGKELRELGVTRLKGNEEMVEEMYVTRLHARYQQGQMKQDIAFRETSNRENFQGRFVIQRPFVGKFDLGDSVSAKEKACIADFIGDTRKRLRDEGKTLAKLTGWKQSQIDARISQTVPKAYR